MLNSRALPALAVALLVLSACGGNSECDPSDPLCSTGGGAPSLSIASVSAPEDGGNAVFNVTLSAGASSTVSVNYATSNGTATAPQDYQATSGSLTFAVGATLQQITVPLWPDVFDEGPNETFTVTLSAPTNATIATGSAVGTITEDDNCALSGSIAVGDTRAAALGSTDCSFSGGEFFDMWMLSLTGTTDVVIDQTSFEIDSWLELWGTDGSFIALNDDVDPGVDINSRIPWTLGSGDYLVVASSFDAGEFGGYELSVR